MLPKIRVNYWSCSKFADFVRGTKKPYALEAKDWKKWHKEAKEKHPLRYWMAEKLLKKLQNIVYLPSDIYNSIKNYIDNRFITKTHCLKTGLKPGKYYELDDRILYALFNELTEFVEIETAHMFSHALKNKGKYKFKKRRCPQAGIDYLKWASRIKENNKPTLQAVHARAILRLYNWWKKRPNRPDPIQASGWDKFCETHKEEDLGFFPEHPVVDDLNSYKERRKILRKVIQIEEKYEKEDTKMLIELIQIRKSLWT
jgi:hypothetical protein